jgi:hypothetical protein
VTKQQIIGRVRAMDALDRIVMLGLVIGLIIGVAGALFTVK